MQKILLSSPFPTVYSNNDSNNDNTQRITKPTRIRVDTLSRPNYPPRRILVIEAAKTTRDVLRIALERTGYEVLIATSGEQGLRLFDEERPIDLVLVETKLRDVDGYTVCAQLRQHSHVPIVLLSDLNQIDQMVHAFGAGADDYIAKPFYFPILQARLQALLRRAATAPQPMPERVIAIDEIVLNADLRQVSVRNQPVNLSPIEYDLLHYLMHMVDRPVSKQELFSKVWGYPESADVNLVRVGVHRLREKIEKDPTEPQYVLTVPGFGYKFQQSVRAN